MFAKSKIVRLACWACLAATWLPVGNGLLQPAQAGAAEVVRVGPIVRVGPVVPAAPIVRVGPVVPVGPVYPHPEYPHDFLEGPTSAFRCRVNCLGHHLAGKRRLLRGRTDRLKEVLHGGRTEALSEGQPLGGGQRPE